MEYKFYLLTFIALILTTPVLGEVTLGKGVVINQPENNLTINVTQKFNTSSLTTYSNTTEFGGSNFSIDNPANNPVDIFLDIYNPNAGDTTYTANFSATAIDGDQVKFEFSELYNDSIYKVQKNNSLLKSSSSTSAGFYNFSNSQWGAKQNFTLRNKNNSRPHFNDTYLTYNKETGATRLKFSINHRLENDISSYSGTGSQVKFTNTTLKVDITLPVDSSYSVTDFQSAQSPSRDLDISETDTGLQPDDYGNNLTKQRINRSIRLNAANDGFYYNLTFGDHGKAVSNTSFNGTISSGSSAANTAEWTGDWINHTLHGFSVTPSEVSLNQSYNGERNLELVEGKAVNWTSLNTTEFTNPPVTCSRSNATTVSLQSSTTSNKTIQFSCNPGGTGSPSFTPIDKSDYEKYWYNTTLTVASNLTENETLVWPIEESNLKNWQDRDAGSAKAIVNGKSSDISIVDGVGTAYVKVQDDFGNSSLHEGSHDAGLSWTYGDDGGSSDGGTTGSTDSSTEDSTSSTDEDTTIRFTETTVRGIPGQTTPSSFVVKNFLAENNSVKIAKKAGNPACQLIDVETRTSYETRNEQVRITYSNEFDDGGTYTIPSRSYGFTEGSFSVRVGVEVDAPTDEELQNQFNGQEELVCPFEVNPGKGKAGELQLEIERRTTLQDVLNNFYRALPLTGDGTQLFKSQDICMDTQVREIRFCPEDKVIEDFPVPAQTASAVFFLLILSAVVIAATRFSYSVLWKRYVLGQKQ